MLIRFCLPLFASVIFQRLYDIADSFVAGKFPGIDALAAIGNSYEITLIYQVEGLSGIKTVLRFPSGFPVRKYRQKTHRKTDAFCRADRTRIGGDNKT